MIHFREKGVFSVELRSSYFLFNALWLIAYGTRLLQLGASSVYGEDEQPPHSIGEKSIVRDGICLIGLRSAFVLDVHTTRKAIHPITTTIELIQCTRHNLSA